MDSASDVSFPPRFTELKKEIAASYPDFEQHITKAWQEVLTTLKDTTHKIAQEGSNGIPQVNFADLENLDQEQVAAIKRKGCVVIRDVVDDDEVVGWRQALENFVNQNDVEGIPADNKQFFQLLSQVLARAHPNMLATQAWLNNLYHTKSGDPIEGVDLSVPLTYADRFRIRHPGNDWGFHPPHIDGGSIERWEDEKFRSCFSEILSGNWRAHDPYDLEGRLTARSSLYKRPNQSTVFRTFQGWLALSATGPKQGTLKVFPDVLMSNAYIILRPFFRPKLPPDSAGFLEPENWEFDISSPKFPGVYPRDGGFGGPQPTMQLHPHLNLDDTMISMPAVRPGDTVYWHCDVVHSVEREHTGSHDSAVMYIPAVPSTPHNEEYVRKQFTAFLEGKRPADFPKGPDEINHLGVGKPGDIMGIQKTYKF
ncbi:hypothetical protein ONZ45_g16928 [Pleurotus djamor]|nr:hypothetical protein ONZ45_g16928 [Pleurotus djamor]